MKAHDRLSGYLDLPLFDGFPYLVTKIFASMHHIIALPADLGEREHERLAQCQWSANRLPTCLVLAVDRALYLADGSAIWADEPPRCDIPICDRLLGPEQFAPTADLAERERKLREFVGAHRRTGYLIDRPHGRKPTPEDRLRLRGIGAQGVPRGLSECGVCRGWRGEAILAGCDLVVAVYCFCDDHNRCARCLHQLRERRLDDCSYFEDIGRVLHVPAFTGLEHRCPRGTRRLRSGAFHS